MKVKEIKIVHDNLYWLMLQLDNRRLNGNMNLLTKHISKNINKHGTELEIELSIKRIESEINSGLLNKEAISIYTILLSNTIESDEEFIKTSIFSIYTKYLGRPLPKDKNKRDEIVKNYHKILLIMEEIYISYKCRKINFNHKLISRQNPKILNNGDIEFEVSLGKYGQKIKEKKQYSNILPIKVLRSKNPCKVLIGIYLARYVFINRKKSINKALRLETLLKQIGYFDIDGNNTQCTYAYKMEQDKISNKSYILNQFIKTLLQVLEELKKKNEIEDYMSNFENNISIKRIKEYEIQIYFNKNE